MYNLKMRLTTLSVLTTSTSLVGLILLMQTSCALGFTVDTSGSLGSTENRKGEPSEELSSAPGPSSSATLHLPLAARGKSVSKRSALSSEPSARRSENSILNVAWPPKGLWGYLPSDKKMVAASTLHSRSSGPILSSASFNQKASSLASSSSLSSSPSNSKKKKPEHSDLFLDPVTLSESNHLDLYKRHRAAFSPMGDHTARGSGNAFFHSSSSGERGVGGGEQESTPPPPPRFRVLQAPARLEPPLGNDVDDSHLLLDNELLDNEALEAAEHPSQSESSPSTGEQANWASHLKRSASSGIVTRSSSDLNKRTRNYDIPQIECPPADDGMERFACPSTDRLGRYRCVDDHVLCDGFVDCPGKEDEDLQACMFYKTTKAHLDVLADALLRWARGKR